jgi:hypothetical protein
VSVSASLAESPESANEETSASLGNAHGDKGGESASALANFALLTLLNAHGDKDGESASALADFALLTMGTEACKARPCARVFEP